MTPTQCLLDCETLFSSAVASALETMSPFLKRTCLFPMIVVLMSLTPVDSTLRPPPVFLSPPAYIARFPALPPVAAPTNDTTSLVLLCSAGGRTLGLRPEASRGPALGEKEAVCKGNARSGPSTSDEVYGVQPQCG
jgi:hypothetical protein